ncbi:hypothetical protein LB456_04595 [Psychroflexus sp. CAK57W]|uniref:hypothetical protein n=1 Tax=Psychroflexus curvus TaxID=2873595 RepID=UPI001CC8FF57|nr:hypothetical protein [Psychroflexus curvus]MBZ9786729.1 hypothetical protein [Psychroflexus curvus]
MTGDRFHYKYLKSDAPNEKINYSYSSFHGQEFIDAYRRTRKGFITKKQLPSIYDSISSQLSLNWTNGYLETEAIFDFWLIRLIEDKEWIDSEINLLIKRFEVTKKIYTTYKEDMRPIDKTSYHDVVNYAKFGLVLAKMYKNTNYFPALNALIKISDIILSNEKFYGKKNNLYVQSVIREEFELVNNLIAKNL